MPDDGSVGAKITPMIDTLMGVSLIFGRRKIRLYAAATNLFFFIIGLAIQVHAGKGYLGDIALVILALATVMESCK